MAYQQQCSQQAYNRHAAPNSVRPPYPSIMTTTASYPPPDVYYHPTNISPMHNLPPTHILQYLSPPLPCHPSPTSSYPSSASTASTGRHSAQSYPSPPYSQTPSSHLYHQHSHQNSPPRSPIRARAVLIGINYFNQKGELRQSCRDARNLYHYLTQVKQYSPSNIILLTDDQNGAYGQPTRRNIFDALSWIGEKAVEGEKVVVYYSGHGRVGSQAKSKSNKKSGAGAGRHGGEREEEGGSVLGEGETIYPVDFRNFSRGMITPEEIEEKLRPAQRRGAKMTVILDTHAAVS